jgi:antitoxin (DNA-binding transcriptional repressor) of toxin-antitoxin stability system
MVTRILLAADARVAPAGTIDMTNVLSHHHQMTARVVNVHEAKTHLSRLLRDVEAGEEIIIARDGKSVARIIRESTLPVPVLGSGDGLGYIADDFDADLEFDTKDLWPSRRLGGDEGTVWIAEDFDELPKDMLDAYDPDDLR